MSSLDQATYCVYLDGSRTWSTRDQSASKVVPVLLNYATTRDYDVSQCGRRNLERIR